MNKVKDQFESKIGSWCPFELEKLNNTDKYKYGRCCIHFQMCWKKKEFFRSKMCNFSNNNTSFLNRVTILEQGCVSNANLMHVR